MTCPHQGLNYTQKEEVRDIVNTKLSNYSFNDQLQNIFRQLNLEHQVHEKVDSRVRTIVPEVGNEWSRTHLVPLTERTASEFMRDNFTGYFRRQIAENKEVTGFISSHLKDVEDRVKSTANSAVDQVVGSSKKFEPIFQSHLSILGRRSHEQIESQMGEFNKSKVLLDRALDENGKLRERIESLKEKTTELESSNSTLKTVSAVNFMSLAGLGLYMFFGGRGGGSRL
jgi:hypothetical protein